MSETKTAKAWAPPLLIVAAPAGTYILLRFAPEYGWRQAGVWAGAAVLVLLILPKLVRAVAKAGIRKARRS